MNAVTAWADETLPEQPVLGKLSHLREEVSELQNVIDNNDPPARIREELADCWLLLLNATKKLGYDVEIVKSEAYAKLAVNKKRTWGKRGEEGQIYHVKQGNI